MSGTASYLGVKKYVPPYLDPTLSIQELVTGVSFASAGSGYDPLTPNLSVSASLSLRHGIIIYEIILLKLSVKLHIYIIQLSINTSNLFKLNII